MILPWQPAAVDSLPLAMAIITLLTDFGADDSYVAAVKGVLLDGAPDATLVDIAHSVAPGDVEGAAFLLAAAAPCFPAGTLHLAVVDPGVGAARVASWRRGGPSSSSWRPTTAC